MSDKIVKIPISHKQRKINEHGNGYVPCEVSERWLQFDTVGTKNGLVAVNVMTKNDKGVKKKICQMVLNKDDLLRALNSVDFDK